ncbi:molybdenum ABC transporter ATP-binding protein [Pararhodospirillum photometricum]|uniref:molybdenum ABC transporter ATP-binding protein n=1 Tax=Pararhodospirillum photometricum TaxID=1084 RepID=UPI0002DEDFEC|nr:molybdenum ABC transporter ATP-binding protein [Pararhodospirillum photometricum]
MFNPMIVWCNFAVRTPHLNMEVIGYVFQEASLFPHLSVQDNLRYGLKRAPRLRTSGPTIAFDDVVELLGIGRLFDRPPSLLSGGERQRVAIGRALLSQPRLLLMDEPLSALDRASKDDILPYLERLHDALALPVLYVSHDLAEVERLADTLVLMAEGQVQTVGPLATVLADPRLPLAGQPQAAVVLEGNIEAYDSTYDLSSVAVDDITLLVPGALGAPGEKRRVRVLATDVSLAHEPPSRTSILNSFPARVISHEPGQDHGVTVLLGLGEDGTGARILARISRKSWDLLALAPGDRVVASLKSVALTHGRAGLTLTRSPSPA